MPLILSLAASLALSQVLDIIGPQAPIALAMYNGETCTTDVYSFHVHWCHDLQAGASFKTQKSCDYGKRTLFDVVYYNDSSNCGQTGSEYHTVTTLEANKCTTIDELISFQLNTSAEVTENNFCAVVDVLFEQSQAEVLQKEYTNANCSGECVDECNPSFLFPLTAIARYVPDSCEPECEGRCCTNLGVSGCSSTDASYWKHMITCVGDAIVGVKATYGVDCINATDLVEIAYYDGVCRAGKVDGEYVTSTLSASFVEATCNLVNKGGAGRLVAQQTFAAELADYTFDYDFSDPASALAVPVTLLAVALASIFA
ncbi:hypothetical protein DIPPA_32614 [Diplonema papillatum]|nr:hypothetical protein DIPPA_32614 [Diplonema papillatum]